MNNINKPAIDRETGFIWNTFFSPKFYKPKF